MRAGDRSCLSYNMQVFNRKDTKTCRYLKANRTLICWLLNRKTFFKGRLCKDSITEKNSAITADEKIVKQCETIKRKCTCKV